MCLHQFLHTVLSIDYYLTIQTKSATTQVRGLTKDNRVSTSSLMSRTLYFLFPNAIFSRPNQLLLLIWPWVSAQPLHFYSEGPAADLSMAEGEIPAPGTSTENCPQTQGK